MHIWGVSASLPASSSQSVRLHNTLCRCSDVLHSVALPRTALHSRAQHCTTQNYAVHCTGQTSRAEHPGRQPSVHNTSLLSVTTSQGDWSPAAPQHNTSTTCTGGGWAAVLWHLVNIRPALCLDALLWCREVCAVQEVLCCAGSFVLCKEFCAVKRVLCCAGSFVSCAGVWSLGTPLHMIRW